MSATYSVNVGTPTEANRKQDINSVLLELPDNTQKLISPKDVRDAFLTAWASSAFKQTIGGANIEYIGIDSGDPSNRDIKQKIFIGKRSYQGADVMNNTLLNDTNSDIYFYNTKPDNYATQSTSLVILAGTNSLLHTNAPYIQSKVINSGAALGLDIVNPSLYGGPVNIYSTTGRVSVNGILFPTLSETSASASNGKILKYSGNYPYGVLKWADPSISISAIGSPGTITNIYGSPSKVNGYSLEFVENSLVPQTIGGVSAGSSFPAGSFNGQNWPLSEVVRKILYPYVAPGLALSVTVGGINYCSTGVTTPAVFSYSVTRYSNIVYSFKITDSSNNVIGLYSGLSYSGAPSTSMTGTFSYNLYSAAVATQSYILSARDNNNQITFSYSATASIAFIDPVFYGFSATDQVSNSAPVLGAFMNSSTRTLITNTSASQSYKFNFSGSGYLCLVVPFSYPVISTIKDPNGYVIHSSSNLGISSFTYSPNAVGQTGSVNVTNLNSWRVYRTISSCSYTGTEKFEFIF